MRQWGLDLARERRGWRRGRRRVRRDSLCELIADLFPQWFEFFCGSEFGLRGPRVRRLPDVERVEEVGPVLEGPLAGVGLGCPMVLGQMAWGPQDPLAVLQFQHLGATIPPVGGVSWFLFRERTIHQLRTIRPGVVEGRSCMPTLQGAELGALMRQLQGMSLADLEGVGLL